MGHGFHGYVEEPEGDMKGKGSPVSLSQDLHLELRIQRLDFRKLSSRGFGIRGVFLGIFWYEFISALEIYNWTIIN